MGVELVRNWRGAGTYRGMIPLKYEEGECEKYRHNFDRYRILSRKSSHEGLETDVIDVRKCTSCGYEERRVSGNYWEEFKE